MRMRTCSEYAPRAGRGGVRKEVEDTIGTCLRPPRGGEWTGLHLPSLGSGQELWVSQYQCVRGWVSVSAKPPSTGLLEGKKNPPLLPIVRLPVYYIKKWKKNYSHESGSELSPGLAGVVLLFCMTIVGSWALKQLQCSSTQSFSRFPWVSCEKRFLHRMVVSGESHSYMVADIKRASSQFY